MARPKNPLRDKRLFLALLFTLVKREFRGDFTKLAQSIDVSRSTIQTWASIASNKVPSEENLAKLAAVDRERTLHQWKAAVELSAASDGRFGQGRLLTELAGPLYDLDVSEQPAVRANKRWAVACRVTQEALQFDIERRLKERSDSRKILFFVWRSMRDEVTARLSDRQFSSYLEGLPAGTQTVGFVYGQNIGRESVLKDLCVDINFTMENKLGRLTSGAPYFSLLRLADGARLEGADQIMDLWAVLVPFEAVTAAWLVSAPDPMLADTARAWGVDRPWDYSASSIRLLARRHAVLGQLGLDSIDWEEKNLPLWTLVYGQKGILTITSSPCRNGKTVRE